MQIGYFDNEGSEKNIASILAHTTGITKGALISGKNILSSAAQAIVHPIDTCHSTFEAFSSLAQLVKSQEWEILGQALAPEISELVNNWENLSSKEQGEMAGYIIGKYGADVFVPCAGTKAIAEGIKGAKELALLARNIQNAEKVMVLDALEGTGGSSGQFAQTMFALQRGEGSLLNASEILIDGFSIQKLADAGKVFDREGLTKAGRALAKHGGREESVFPKPIGNPSQINQQGQKILDYILSHPEKSVKGNKVPRFGEVIDIKLPEGYGARFFKNGEFIGFLEP